MKKMKKNIVLPDKIAVAFKRIPYTSRCKCNADEVRTAYVTVLRDKGWTFQSIANASGGISHQRVQQLCKIMEINYAKMIVQNFTPALPLPDVPEKPTPSPRTKPMLTAETLDRLLELKPLAAKSRGANSHYTKEADEFVALLWYAHAIEGVSVYLLQKLLSVGGIERRLVRYGYKSSNNTHRDFQPLQRRMVAV